MRDGKMAAKTNSPLNFLEWLISMFLIFKLQYNNMPLMRQYIITQETFN